MKRQRMSDRSDVSVPAVVEVKPPQGKPARAAGSRGSSGHAEESTSSHAIRVLCVDDHAVLVEGLRAQFAIERRIEIVGRLGTVTKLLEEVERLKPAAVLLDIEMEGPDAFEMADRLRHAHPEVRIIVLSAHIRDSFISASFAAGASGYFSKVDELDDIVHGIVEVMQSKPGTFVLSPRVREQCRPLAVHGRPSVRHIEREPLADGGSSATRLDMLTARELEILRLIGKGLSRVQIGAQLCRSAKTIDGHQDRMMKKLGIIARADLIRFAIREGLSQA